MSVWNKGTGLGTRIHEKGYVQIIRRGPWRGWLQHRQVMLWALQESLYWHNHPQVADGKIPDGMTVEHLDHKKAHNCIENLMLLDKRIHDYISLDHAHMMAGVRASIYEVEEVEEVEDGDGEEPEWVNE